MSELKLRCDICGKEYPESQVFALFDENWDIYYICINCVKKKWLGGDRNEKKDSIRI